ncbi:LysR substrate-binding domain-containing protein [Roseovarius sp.]|uniref:LysR substrate-binding domain-containing protein n=1 Tax=Roseovarius sp. TaxID=1486281 RepID=UPI0026025CC0|nr:LysR substrate-binding domain-containing protein [Roseovarius sp.]MDM8165755.1 LysR substrate-binding domain-containing protein [Roseovarius sp.]
MSLRSRLPSSGALFVFESAARKLSFSDASREFNVTQPAVSKTIRQLEEDLGVRLFERGSGGVTLTRAGQILADAVTGGFSRIEAAFDEIERLKADPDTVTLSVTSAFAMHWFMPRMDLFRQTFPDIPIRFQILHDESIGPLDGASLGLRRTEDADYGFDKWFLQQERVVAVASPAYVAAHGGLKGCESLAGHTLGHLNQQLRLPWAKYLSEMGFASPAEAAEIRFSDYALLMQAVIKGQCIGLGWRYIVEHELEQKGLVTLCDRDYLTGLDYHVVAAPDRPLRETTAQVRDWLIAELRTGEAPARTETG